MTGFGFRVPPRRGVPRIESKTPGAFDESDRPVVAEARCRYQVDAVLMGHDGVH